MAPGVIQNSDTVLNSTLATIAHNENLISGVTDDNKICPIDHIVLSEINDQSGNAKDLKIQIHKLDRKKPRKVTRPKVLKNHESREYLYDRLYDTTCPSVVSLINDKVTGNGQIVFYVDYVTKFRINVTYFPIKD